MTRISRRRFLEGSLSLLAMPGLAGTGCRPGGVSPGPRFDGRIVGASHRAGHRLFDGVGDVPAETAEIPVLILGGGMSGLSAAWKLAKSGLDEFLILELESGLGGTSRSDRSSRGGYPWGAHYVPLPTEDCTATMELFEELGVLTGRDAGGRPVFEERYQCFAPQERLFLHGAWQEGLFPRTGAGGDDLAQYEAFRKEMVGYHQARDRAGRKAFAIPMDRSSRDPEFLALDRISMAGFLDRRGLTSRRLRWYVDYCCRDDYGLEADRTSAWAGIHYFASRLEADERGEASELLTWPEGNGWIVGKLQERVGRQARTGVLVHRVRPSGEGFEVDGLDLARRKGLRIRCRHLIFALPKFEAPYLLSGDLAGRFPDFREFSYAPWVVANLFVSRIPRGRGAEPAWDNVLYESEALGYVIATHQRLEVHESASIITYYWPLCKEPPDAARRRMLETSWEDWCEAILADLGRPHPDLAGIVERIDVMLWGHGMIQPKVGFMWSGARERAGADAGNLVFAHADLSGLSLFEEAQYRGVKAAETVLTRLGHPFRSSLG